MSGFEHVVDRRCVTCGYGLRGLPHLTPHCPECGTAIHWTPPPAPPEPTRFRSFRLTVGPIRRPRSFETRSLVCPSCGFADERFIPCMCAWCGQPFTWRQRFFGSKPHAA